MSVQSSQRRFRYVASLADLFADPSSGFVYPLIQSAEPSGGPKVYPRKFLATDHDHYPSLVGEDESIGLKFATEMRGFGGANPGAANGVQALDGENGLLLASVFGRVQKDTGNTCASGTTASAITATSATLLSVGNVVGFVDPATGKYYARQIRTKVGSVLTLDRALPFTPAIGATIYASATYAHATQGHQHLWFDVEGYDPTAANNWRRVIRGCLGDLAFKIGSGIGQMEWTFKGVDWAVQDGTTQGAPVYPANLPAGGVLGHRLTRIFVGATEQKVTDLAFNLGNDVQPKPSTSALNGVAGFYIKDAKRDLTFTALHDDGGAALVAMFVAGTRFDCLIELTSGGPGNAFAIVAPVVEITGYKAKAVNGLDGYEFSCAVVRNDTIVGVADVALAVL